MEIEIEWENGSDTESSVKEYSNSGNDEDLVLVYGDDSVETYPSGRVTKVTHEGPLDCGALAYTGERRSSPTGEQVIEVYECETCGERFERVYEYSTTVPEGDL